MKHEEAIKEWDLVIKPKQSLFKLDLMDVWRYRDLLGLFVKRDFVSVYKQTVLGPIWLFLQPLFTTFIYVFIFGKLAGLSTDGLPKPLFYLTGIVAWNYFSECLNKTSTVFVNNAHIFGKVYFPRLIMPLSIIVSSLVRLGIQLLLFFCLEVYYISSGEFSFHFSYSLFLVPYFILLLAMLGLGFGMFVSSLTTKYRDLSYLLTFGVQLLMYATPIIYPLSSAPEKYKNLISLNPLSPIIEGFRFCLLGKGEIDFSSIAYTSVMTILMLIIGVLTFNKVEKDFVDTV